MQRNTAFENIDRAIRQSLLKLQIDISDINMIASIDVKKDEPGIKEFCDRNRIDFVTYTADELMAVQGEFECLAVCQGACWSGQRVRACSSLHVQGMQ